ncbi:MAG: hypothetical protein JO127_13840 [Caulobacteraceae bacterium]|nr:hypothetical protein [Caulobacteraceae bacterium]
MRRSLALIAAVAIALAAGAADAKQCKDPKTGKFIKCPPAAAATAAPATTAAAASATTGGHPPHCTVGKPCGNSCIAKDKVCHKP